MSATYKQRVQGVWRGGRLPCDQIVQDADYPAMVEYLRLGRDAAGDEPAKLNQMMELWVGYASLYENRRRRKASGRLIECGAIRCAIEDEINMLVAGSDGREQVINGSALKMHLTGDRLAPRKIFSDLTNMQQQIRTWEADVPRQMTGVTHRDLASLTARVLDTEMFQVVRGIDPITHQSILTCMDAARAVKRRPANHTDRELYMVVKSTEEFLEMDFSRYTSASSRASD